MRSEVFVSLDILWEFSYILTESFKGGNTYILEFLYNKVDWNILRFRNLKSLNNLEFKEISNFYNLI